MKVEPSSAIAPKPASGFHGIGIFLTPTTSNRFFLIFAISAATAIPPLGIAAIKSNSRSLVNSASFLPACFRLRNNVINVNLVNQVN